MWHSTIRNMKSIIASLLFAFPLCVIACSKSATESDSSEKQTDSEYYVKYASDGLNGNGIYEYNVSYTDEQGDNKSFSNMTSDSYERIIGPVPAGFEASFRIWVANTNDTKTRAARIEVKKDDGPFVVKVEKSGKGFGGVSVTYTIE